MAMGLNLAQLEQHFGRFMFKNLEDGNRRRLWLKLATLLRNDVQLINALRTVRDRRVAAGMKGDPVTIALSAWITEILAGKKLSNAIAGWVSEKEQMLIAAGEDAGDLQSGLESTIKVLESQKAIKGALIGGLAYPMFLIMLSYALLYLFGFKIVPAFQNAVPGDGWTGMARATMKISTFARDWLWLIAALTVGLIVAFFVSLPRLDGKVRVWLDRFPPYSIYRLVHGSSWLIATAALVNAGMRNETVLEKLAANAGPWLRTRINAALRGLRDGYNLGDALARAGHEFPDREIIDDLGTYASLAGFDRALAILGNEWLTNSVEEIRARMKIVFGVCVLVLGALISIMASGLMAMQQQLSQLIQGVGM